MATALTVVANTGAVDLEYLSSGSEWTSIDQDNDRLIFSAGDSSVADGESSPSATQLNSAGTFLYTGHPDITVARYFLDDNDAGVLKEITNMGEGNYRYVLGFSFDNSTASEPIFEAWDDSDLSSVNSVCLGSGTPANSFMRGICTTDGLPGASWSGSRLAGSSDGYFIYLNNENGALSGADVLYMQLKIVIPSSQLTAFSEQPVLVCKFAST